MSWTITVSVEGPPYQVINTANWQTFARFEDLGEAKRCMAWLNNGGGIAV